MSRQYTRKPDVYTRKLDVEALDEAASIIEREEQKFERTILPDGYDNILFPFISILF
jgi:hypothetical protein